MRFSLLAVAMLFPLAALAGSQVPEIDPGSAVSAITVALGSVCLLTGRRTRK